jgi:DNA polymerase III epsilon subunit-like protein
MIQPQKETYISVDVETAGPIPGEYSLLSIGACVVDEPENGFYVELKPINGNAIPEALQVGGLSLENLAANGKDPAEAMKEFAQWTRGASGGGRPVLVAFNAPFDWSFVNYYFHRFLGKNPFGIGALDIKAYYMGLSGCLWSDTRAAALPPEYRSETPLTHNALDDARDQAGIFHKMRQSRVNLPTD